MEKKMCRIVRNNKPHFLNNKLLSSVNSAIYMTYVGSLKQYSQVETSESASKVNVPSDLPCLPVS